MKKEDKIFIAYIINLIFGISALIVGIIALL